MLAMMFKGIHVDFVPFTVSGEMKENGFGGRQYYENLKVKGAVTKKTARSCKSTTTPCGCSPATTR